jgi:tRNA(Arg) A34 adenosine deaminase TadA
MPEWTHSFVDSIKDKEFDSDEEMMKVAIDLARFNVIEGTGGPFGCAIFETDKKSGKSKIFSVGANRVTTLNNSTLHGEMVAIQFAQKKLKTFALKDPSGEKEYALFTSCEPCAMCLGGTFWSGVSRMVCAATKADAEAIGFNEGPVFPESYDALENAGIRVHRKVLQGDGATVLKMYAETGIIYNGQD